MPEVSFTAIHLPLSSDIFMPFPTMPGAPLRQLKRLWVPASGRRQFIY